MPCCPMVSLSGRADGLLFLPNKHMKPLTLKFYARHDAQTECMGEKIKKYRKKVDSIMDYDVRQHRYTPLTENQKYGWAEHRGIRRDTKDPAQAWRPIITDEIMKLRAEAIRQYRDRV